MPTPLIRDEVAALLERAVEAAQAKGRLPPTTLPPTPVERPANLAHGDYASTIALKLARAAGMKPREIAEIIVAELPASPVLGQVGIAGPGFINFTLSDRWLAEQVDAIVGLDRAFGAVDLGRGMTVQVEFVSANPVGPLPVPAGRGGALGDSLARILTASGYRVEREYYVNDHGSRILAFGQSLLARYLQLFGQDVPVPADGYHGEYVGVLAGELKETRGDAFLKLAPEVAAEELARIGVDYYVDVIRRELERLGIRYDRWFSENLLYERGDVARILEVLRERGYIANREGAIWFVSSALGEDKDNVLVRSNGEPTYFASDIAYHFDKFVTRGFGRVIDVWGADHQGHVGRTKAAVGALGIDPERLQIVINQMVTLKVDGQPVRMSKRSGNIVTLEELLDDVGPDVCRYFFLSRSADTHLDFDLDLARKQSDENPVYYVQYAHARICAILKRASSIDFADADVSLLRHAAELALIRKMLELPELVETAATSFEPHHLPHYALDLASVFHRQFYAEVRVIPEYVKKDDPRPLDEAIRPEDLPLTRARLKLLDAARIALRNTLDLIGVSAPERKAREGEPEAEAV